MTDKKLNDRAHTNIWVRNDFKIKRHLREHAPTLYQFSHGSFFTFNYCLCLCLYLCICIN